MNNHSIITINLQQEKKLLQSTNSKKYQVLILLMLDCGLRVSEVIQLQSKHILFSENKIKIVSNTKSREIPLTQRLLKSLVDYWQQLPSTRPEEYIFLVGGSDIKVLIPLVKIQMLGLLIESEWN